MKIYIGCDVGTSSTKAVAVDENGKVLAEGSKKYTFIQKHNNWAEQEPDVWLDGAVESIKAVIGQIDEACIERICISALYAGTGAMLDENMNSIRPALIWLDRRAEKESAWAQENLADKIAEVTDNGIDSYFGYIKLLWVKNNEPENWKKLESLWWNTAQLETLVEYMITETTAGVKKCVGFLEYLLKPCLQNFVSHMILLE